MSLICPKRGKILNKNRKYIFQHLIQSKKSHQPDCHDPQSLKIPAVFDGFSLGTTVMLTIMVLSWQLVDMRVPLRKIKTVFPTPATLG